MHYIAIFFPLQAQRKNKNGYIYFTHADVEINCRVTVFTGHGRPNNCETVRQKRTVSLFTKTYVFTVERLHTVFHPLQTRPESKHPCVTPSPKNASITFSPRIILFPVCIILHLRFHFCGQDTPSSGLAPRRQSGTFLKSARKSRRESLALIP